MADEDQILTLESIEKTDDIQYDVVPVPEWKGSVRLGSLDGVSALKWGEEDGGIEGKTAGIRLLILSLVDKDGNRIGSEEAVAMMRKKNARIVTRLVNAALKLNGLDTKSIEERKNASGEATPAASPTV